MINPSDRRKRFKFFKTLLDGELTRRITTVKIPMVMRNAFWFRLQQPLSSQFGVTIFQVSTQLRLHNNLSFFLSFLFFFGIWRVIEENWTILIGLAVVVFFFFKLFSFLFFSNFLLGLGDTSMTNIDQYHAFNFPIFLSLFESFSNWKFLKNNCY